MAGLASQVIVELMRYWTDGACSAQPQPSLFQERCGCRFCRSARSYRQLVGIEEELSRATQEKDDAACGRLLGERADLMQALFSV